MPPKQKRPKRRYAKPNKKTTKQKMTQKVNVNVSSTGGSGGGGSSQPYHAPPAFYDRRGENVILQRLSDAVNSFMAKAQNVQTLEPSAFLPSNYNDSPVDDVTARNKLMREARLGNPILNPRPSNISQSLMAQVSETHNNLIDDENAVSGVSATDNALGPEAKENPSTPRLAAPVFPENDSENIELTTPELKAQRKQNKISWIENERDNLIKKLTELQFLNVIDENDFVRIGSANYKTKKSIKEAIQKASNQLIAAQLKNQNLSPIHDDRTRLVI